MKIFIKILFIVCCGVSFAQNNQPNNQVNLALLGDATLSGSVSGGRGIPLDILYDPAVGDYANKTSYNEYGVSYGVNLGTPNADNGLIWQVDWATSKTINYITFGGTYPNQPQPNTLWRISYLNNGIWNTLQEGQGGWVDSGIFEWGGVSQAPVIANAVRVQLYSDGNSNLVHIHLRGRGGDAFSSSDSGTETKATLIQYLPGNGADTESPSAPNNLSSTIKTDTTVNLNWNNSTDNVAVTGYKIYKGGVLEFTLGNVTTHQVTGLAASTNYDFTVTALDAVGNESAYSNTITVATNSSGGSTGGSTVWSESSGNIFYTSGNVSIATNTVPVGYKLAVDGKIIVEEVKVEMSGTWPDYVFTKDYTLPTLEEVEKHIAEKGHLINIPSAEEVEANGIELGEMNKLLLEKIEELTLYILEQEKEIEKVRKLENRILKLENRNNH